VIAASEALREAIASFYEGAGPENVCVTTGTSEANFLALTSLVAPGDKVAIVLPTYMQAHGWVKALGADVAEIWLEEPLDWQFDPHDMRRAVHGAKVVYVCDPNNPTGSQLSPDALAALRDAARETGAWLVADQVYRGAERDGPLTASHYRAGEHVIVTAGLSKVFGLPGLRVGWVVTTPEMAERIWSAHDYSTIAPTTLSALFAERALHSSERLIERARAIVRAQWPVLEAWLGAHDFHWIAPQAGAIVLARRDLGSSSAEFVDRLIHEESAMVVPGEHFLLEGYLRIGFGMARDELEAGLARVASLLSRLHARA